MCNELFSCSNLRTNMSVLSTPHHAFQSRIGRSIKRYVATQFIMEKIRMKYVYDEIYVACSKITVSVRQCSIQI